MKFLEGHLGPFFHTAVVTPDGRVNYLYHPLSDDLAEHEAASIHGTTKKIKRNEKYSDSRGKEVIHGVSLKCGGDCRAHKPGEE